MAGSLYENDPFYATLFEDGKIMPLDQGRRWSRPEYADTITILAEEGVEPFYTGRVAEAIVKVVRERGGVMTMEDLKSESFLLLYLAHRLPSESRTSSDVPTAYEVKWLDVISADYKGGKLYSVPAPASGAIWMSALGALSQHESEGEGSDIDMHRTTEAIKVSLLDIKTYRKPEPELT